MLYVWYVLQVSEANIARAAAEARQLELERANSQLRLEVTASQATARSTMEEAVRLLSEWEELLLLCRVLHVTAGHNACCVVVGGLLSRG